jgi:hypothetical protein
LRDEPPISALTGFLGFARSFSRFAFALAILAVETQVRDVEPGDFGLPRSAGEREQQDPRSRCPLEPGPIASAAAQAIDVSASMRRCVLVFVRTNAGDDILHGRVRDVEAAAIRMNARICRAWKKTLSFLQ